MHDFEKNFNDLEELKKELKDEKVSRRLAGAVGCAAAAAMLFVVVVVITWAVKLVW